MQFVRTFGFLLVGMALVLGCSEKAKDGSRHASAPWLPAHAQPKLPTIRLWLGMEELITEMALTGEQQMTGMMYRTNIAENEAMIFVHPVPRPGSYWMTNCFVPLSIAYIDTDGEILEIHDLQPHNANPVFSKATNVRFGLETSQGWFQRHNVSTGAVIRTERGSLAETFLRHP